MKIVFGQILLPYRNGKTSIEVALYLEKKYHLKETFFNQFKDKIIKLWHQAFVDAWNNMLRGGYVHPDINMLLGKANDTVTQWFRDVLNKRGFDGVIRGVPTFAAQLGISSRFKSGFTTKVVNCKRIRISRPSFIDTQLYRNSSKTWIEE